MYVCFWESVVTYYGVTRMKWRMLSLSPTLCLFRMENRAARDETSHIRAHAWSWMITSNESGPGQSCPIGQTARERGFCAHESNNLFIHGCSHSKDIELAAISLVYIAKSLPNILHKLGTSLCTSLTNAMSFENLISYRTQNSASIASRRFTSFKSTCMYQFPQ